MAGPAPLFREIHRLRSFIHDLEEQLGRLPRALKARQATLTRHSEALTQAQETIKSLKVTTATNEKSIKSKTEAIARFEGQLGGIQSKKEYDAKQLEIAFAKAEISKLEEGALEAMEQAETLTATLPELEKAVALAREEARQFEAEMEGRRATWQAELGRAKAKLAEAEPKIPRDVRTVYEKAVQSMGHDGFAEVSGRTCGGCQGDITVQDRYQLEAEQFLMCNCGRILYLPETKPTREEAE